MSTKTKPYKLVRGDFCFIHVLSPILREYFKEYGQPLIDEDLASACFEGKVVRTPLPISKQKCSSDHNYQIEIGALNKAGGIFEATIELLRDSPYFVKDVAEPDGWNIQSRSTMTNLYQNNEISEGARASAVDTTPRTSVVVSTSRTAVGATPTPFRTSVVVPTPLPVALELPTMASVEDSLDDMESADNYFDEGMDVLNVNLAEKDNSDHVLGDAEPGIDENATAWESLNTRFEKKYDRGAKIKIRPSEEDMNFVLNFIQDASEPDYKELGSLWLEKFQNFIDEDRAEPIVLRPRTPALRTNHFINESSSSLDAINNLLTPTGSASSISTSGDRIPRKVFDLSFLSDDMPSIPELRSDEKFQCVRVNYNELENFFRITDKKTKFENLYDILCVAACHTMYTENSRCV